MDEPREDDAPNDSSRPTRPETPPAEVLSWLAFGAARTRRVGAVIVAEKRVDEGWNDVE